MSVYAWLYRVFILIEGFFILFTRIYCLPYFNIWKNTIDRLWCYKQRNLTFDTLYKLFYVLCNNEAMNMTPACMYKTIQLQLSQTHDIFLNHTVIILVFFHNHHLLFVRCCTLPWDHYYIVKIETEEDNELYIVNAMLFDVQCIKIHLLALYFIAKMYEKCIVVDPEYN